MRQKRFVLFCFAVMMASCTQQLSEQAGTKEESGQVAISVCGDDFTPAPKATVDAEFVPDINDLKIEVFKNPGEEQVRLYRDTYANTVQKPAIGLNCADYRILASYGDSLGVGFDPQKIYYSGIYDFTLEPNELEEAVVVVSPSNVRASVVFKENVNYDYSDFYAKVRSQTKGGKVKSLRYDYDETRAGFVPAGKVRVELYVKIDGKEMYCPGPDIDVEGGTDMTFTVETVRLESEVAFDITVSMPERKDYSCVVPAVMLPKDSPQIDVNALSGEAYVLEPGDEPVEDLRMDIKADGKIEHCWLDVKSAYLSGLGVPDRVDLASDDLGLEDEAQAKKVSDILKSVGLRWMSGMSGSRLAYVDFSGVTDFMSKTPCTPLFDADFSVELVDARQQAPQTQHVGTISTDTYSFRQVIPAPTIGLSGFDGFESGRVLILEGNGVTYEGMNATLKAKGGIAHCWLDVDSPYLKAAGVNDTRIDLANIDENGNVASVLRSFGLSWTENMAGMSDAVVDFSGISDYMDKGWCDGYNTKFAHLSLSLENAHYGSEAEKSAEVKVADFDYVVPSVSIRDNVIAGNVWAKKIVDFSADCSIDAESGIQLPEGQFKIQYSTPEGWVDVPSTSYVYPTRSCAKFVTEPDTEYMMRAVYHDNPNLVAEFEPSVTEKELQIEGSDFNKWDSFTHQYYTEKIQYDFLFFTVDCGGGTYLSRDYYNNQPTYIWAVNSMKTMPQTTTPNFTINISSIHYETGETQTYKVFPTVTKYIVDLASRNNAAQIATIHVCNMATAGDDGTGTWGSIGSGLSVDREAFYAAGEICTGSSDAKGNLSYDGYAFESRPSKMTVRYRYDSYNSETGYMKFEMKSGNEVIAVHEYKPGAASDWTEYTFDVPYSSTTKKATSVCVTFKSTSASSPAYKGNEARTLTVDGADYNVHSGSVLWIDDVRLIYE